MLEQKALPAAATLEEKVKERVKGFMLDALGDEEVEKLVKQSISLFLKGGTTQVYEGYAYKTVTLPSELEKMVKEAVYTDLRQRVGESLKGTLGPMIDTAYGKDDVSDAARAVIKDCGPALLEGVIKGFTAQLVPSVAAAVVNAIQMNPGVIPAGMIRTY